MTVTLFAPDVVQRGLNRKRGPAAAEDERFLAFHVDARFSQHVDEAEVVRVVAAQQAAVVDYRVDAADAPRLGREPRAVGNHVLFIWDCDIEAAEGSAFEEASELAALELYEAVVVAAELAVNVRGKAVSELFPDKAVSGFSHQQIASL